MKVIYSLYNVPNLQSENKKKNTSQARIVSSGTVKTDELCKHISSRSTLSAADIKATLDSLSFYFELFLSQGKSIELNELGIFSLGLKSQQTQNEEGKTFTETKIKGIHFKPTPKLKEKIKGFQLEYQKRKTPKQYTQEERLTRIIEHVEKHHYITCGDCRSLNNSTIYTANMDLQQLVDSNKLLSVGTTRNRVYIKGE